MTDRNEVTNHEKLIEEAAKALTGLTDDEWEIATAEGTEHLTGYFDAARRIRAVFEKACTPTDDEREADEKAILNALHDSREAFTGVGAEVGTDETAILVDHVPEIVLALGFRRSEAVSDDEREALLTEADTLVASWDQKGSWSSDSPIGMVMRHADALRRSEVPEPSTEGPAFIAIMPPSPETSKRWYSMYCRECGVEEMMAETADDPRLIERRDAHNRVIHPQGEPSDADLDAARAEIAARMNYKVEPTRDAMRAALRAANDIR